MTVRAVARGLGRPPATSHAAIEEAAFTLFEAKGFDPTTMDDIADAVGVGRRTIFRYYPSKNDILWGQFDESLRAFEASFEAMSPDVPLATAITNAIIEFNTFDDVVVPQHRRRMKLLLETPALLAHSELRYTAWRGVVERFVAQRRNLNPANLVPALVGRVSLAIALTAYEQWLARPDASLQHLIAEAASAMTDVYDFEE